MALKDISRECTDSMKSYAKAVITSIQQALQADQPILSDHLPALGQLSKTSPTPDSRARLLIVLERLTMLLTTQDIAWREDWSLQPPMMRSSPTRPHLCAGQQGPTSTRPSNPDINFDLLPAGVRAAVAPAGDKDTCCDLFCA